MKKTLGLLMLVLATVSPAAAGIYYEALNQVDGEGAEMQAWRVRGWVDGANAKIEFLDSGNPMMPAGSYLLTTDAGETMFLVRPADGTYSRFDLQAILGAVGNLSETSGGMIDMEFVDPKVEKLEERRGEAVAGRDTTYYRYRTSYGMVMKMMGMKRNHQFVIDQEIWSTDLSDHEGFGVFLSAFRSRGGDSGLQEVLEAELGKMEGFPLKTVTVTNMSSGRRGGGMTPTTSRMEVMTLREEAIAGGTWELDSSLEEVPMMLLPGMGGEEEQEGGGLRGLLKRRRGGG